MTRSDRAGPALEQALVDAEAAQARGDLAGGLRVAEQAWDLSAGADAALRLRAGRLVLHFRYRSGALARLVDAGLEVLPLMRQAGTPAAELIDTLRMVTLGAAEVGRFEVAMALGHEAHRLADGAADLARLSLSMNALGCVYERIGDPWHAERLMLDGLAIAREAGGGHAEFVALNNLTATLIGAYYLLQGSAPDDEVQRTLQRALPHAEAARATALASGEAFYLAFVRGNYGELLLHLGRVDEARVELEAAMQTAQQGGFEAQVWRVGFTLGELQLRLGDPAAAWAQLQAALQLSTVADARAVHMRLHHALWRAARALGQPEQALHHLEQFQRLERERMLSQLRGQSQIFVTKVEAEQVRLEARRAGERAARAETSARVDQLTGLGNRRELELRWPPLMQQLQGQQLPLALVMADLDHFKQVNDRYGHAVGDAVLVTLAKLLRDNTREQDMIIRVGGEEFLLVLPEADATRALEICERLRQRVAAHGWELVAPGLQISLSIGLASAPPYELRSLIERADEALYAAKRAGRNAVRLAPSTS